ncbi:MAG: hypothetical protein J0I99_18385 [Devosia sp.]|uniref:hypothetical protein n=1 Tax=Devosia sp. TaxID=1871048 RepID=UPI001AD41158|nr:hypothetical protein [Devosia sp.]MBN9317712.1 hypothetical protein [Devosia sp.]
MPATSKRPAIAFIFAVVRKLPNSGAELATLAPVAEQHRLIAVQVQRGFVGKGARHAVTTYRRQRFVDHPAFGQACDDARAISGTLLIGDVFGSMRNLEAPDAIHCMKALDALEIDVINALDGRMWTSYATSEKQSLYRAEKTRSQLRGVRIKSGMPKKLAAISIADAHRRQKRAATTLQKNAYRRALALKEVVSEILSSTGAESISASVLAKELNTRGIRSSRGKNWSPTTADRLWTRLKEMEKLDDPS